MLEARHPDLPKARSTAALCLITAAALLLEVTLMRLISVALWYPLAYLALATAMLGFGCAAVVVAQSSRLRATAPNRLLALAAAGFAFTTAVGYPLWNLLPVDPMGLAGSPGQLLLLPLFLILLTLPFFCAGLFVARIFAARPGSAAKLYAADLCGAAAGALVYVAALPTLGGPGTLMFAAGLGAIAGLLLLEANANVRLFAGLACAVPFVLAPKVEQWLPLRISSNKLMGSTEAQGRPRHTMWSSHAAIDVIEAREGAYIVIDGGTAMTLAPRVGPNGHLQSPSGLRALPFRLGPGRSTLIVGSGGGVEVQAALGARCQRILALEVNGAINDLVRQELAKLTGGLFAYPAVELRTVEARSYLAAHHQEKFDAIMAFHTISNAASSTGAFGLAENYLLTREAMALLLDRLTDQGVLVVSRPEPQLGRLAATLSEAWPHQSPVRDHVAVVTHGMERPSFVGAIVIKHLPLTQADIDTVRALTPGRVLFLPDGSGEAQPFFEHALGWQQQVSRSAAHQAAQALPYRPVQLRPSTDARPYFNLQRAWLDIGWGDLLAIVGAGSDARTRLEDLPVSQVSVLVLLLEVVLLGAVFLWAPARALTRNGFGAGSVAQVAFYFGCLGLAFMTVEITLIQTMTRLTGHPAWSVVTVLCTLLAGTGLGSLWLAGHRRWGPRRGALGACGASLLVAALLPGLVDLLSTLPFAVRLGGAVLCVFPVGLLLGVPFPAGMGRLKDERTVAWAWAHNSLLSVSGSIAALVLGSSIGLPAAAVAAALVYGVASLSAPRATREGANQ